MGRTAPARSPFAASPEALVLVDRIAKRYGRLPHEVMELSPYQFTVAALCVQQAADSAEQAIGRINRSGGMVFPVLDLGG